MKLIIIHCPYHLQPKAMRVMEDRDLLTIMECHFQRSIRKAINLAFVVQITINTGESEYQSSCAYYYCKTENIRWWPQNPDLA